jgi:hypothetical protein
VKRYICPLNGYDNFHPGAGHDRLDRCSLPSTFLLFEAATKRQQLALDHVPIAVSKQPLGKLLPTQPMLQLLALELGPKHR